MFRLKRLVRLLVLWGLLIGCSSELLIRLWVHYIYQSPLPQTMTEPAFEEPAILPQGFRNDQLHMVPNFRATAESTGILYETNAWAFRDDPVDRQKRHVIFLGDSTTFGLNIPHEATYAEVWERLVGDDWQAINTAVPGRGTISSYEVLQDVLARGIRPEGVVIGFFANDPRNDADYGVSLETNGILAHWYTGRIASALLAHYHDQQHDQPLDRSLEYVLRIRDTARQANAATTLLYIPIRASEVYNRSLMADALATFAETHTIPFVDGAAVYRNYLAKHDLDTVPDGFYSIPGDMGHPGILSSELLGQAIYARMQLE